MSENFRLILFSMFYFSAETFLPLLQVCWLLLAEYFIMAIICQVIITSLSSWCCHLLIAFFKIQFDKVIGMTSDFQLKPKHFLIMLWNSGSYLNLWFKLLWHANKASLTLVWKRAAERKGGGQEKPGGARCPSRDRSPCAPLGFLWYPRWEASQYAGPG